MTGVEPQPALDRVSRSAQGGSIIDPAPPPLSARRHGRSAWAIRALPARRRPVLGHTLTYRNDGTAPITLALARESPCSLIPWARAKSITRFPQVTSAAMGRHACCSDR